MADERGGRDENTPKERKAWVAAMLGLFPSGRLIDLGSGHGQFAQMATDLGWEVTATDVRAERFPVDDRITWRVEDIRDADVSGFDLILCLGLFYHLALPDQLDLLRRCAGTPIVLDTHVATGGPAPMKLSEMRTVGGYEGQLYKEPDQIKNPTASWGNDTSFWPTPAELVRMLGQFGYSVLSAQPFYLPTRSFFLCLPRHGA
jgi:SAM-dependent methyltransferase